MKLRLTINGVTRQVVTDPQASLLDLLRDTYRLTGAKQSCDKKGQCGACTVIVNGKAMRSCTTKLAKLDGADIITVEGLGTPANPHLIQEAFVLAGAVQCGFCIPGMIMAAKALLDTNPDPSTAGDPARPAPQPVSLHGLCEDRRGGEAGRRRSCAARRRPTRCAPIRTDPRSASPTRVLRP